MGKVARRVVTGASLAVAAGTVLWLNGRFAPGWVPLGAAFVLALLGGQECARMGTLRSLRAAPSFLAAALLGALAGGYVLAKLPGMLTPGEAPVFAAILYGLAALAAAPLLLFRRGEGQPSSGLGFLLVLWVVPVLFLWVPLGLHHGTAGLVVLVVLSKIGDIFGYFVGRAIGRTHPFPNLSPGKTTAGCVASLVSGTVAGAVLLPLTLASAADAGAVLVGAGVGALVNVAAQAGDLAESRVKRLSGVKDSSGLVGAAGGVLDVIDSLLFTTPVALLTWGLVS